MENQNAGLGASGVVAENTVNIPPNASSTPEGKIMFNEPQVSSPTVPPPVLPIDQNISSQAAPQIKYAGFWVRYVANVIDGLILVIPIVIVTIVLTLLLSGFMIIPAGGKQSTAGFLIGVLIRLIVTLLGWSYFILMTKKYQATLGKMAVGIKIVSDKSEELTLGQIILRETVGKILSAITLYIGYIMAGFTKRKQALHDKIAKTIVVHKDPNQKIAWWAIALALILPAIAIIGILASIVLVSLSSARGKANDAYIKSMVSSAIPEAILYADGNNNSYNGFVPTITFNPDIQKCSGQPIINISPDGQNMAIFAKLCSDGTKYFCADSNNKPLDVGEQYAQSGAYSCDPNEASSRAIPSTTMNNTPESQTPTINNDSDLSALNQVNTQEAYNKSVSLLNDKTNIKLKSINVDRISPNYANKIEFVFTTDKKIFVVDYDVVNKITQITGTEALSVDQIKKAPSLASSYPELPDAMLSSGFEGAMRLLYSNGNYLNYKAKNPDVFSKYIAITEYTDQYGWEWKIMYMKKGVSAGGDSSILFAVNPEKNQIIVLKKNNLVE